MKDNHEFNQAKLENFLDTSTTLFFRAIKDRHGLNWTNGTALGTVSLGSGIPPTGEGGYWGYFTFMDRKGNALVINTDGPYSFAGTTFMNQMSNGRGHEISYVKVPEGFETYWAMDRAGREKLVEDLISSSEDVPLVGKTRDYVSDLISQIKEAEFMTLRKYTLDSNDTPKEDKPRIKRVFKRAIDRALIPFNEPVVPMFVEGAVGEYEVRNLTSRLMVLSKYGSRTKEVLKDKIMLPTSELDSEGLKDPEGLKRGILRVHYILKQGGDASNGEDWELCNVHAPSYISKKALYSKRPEFLEKGKRRYVKLFSEREF